MFCCFFFRQFHRSFHRDGCLNDCIASGRNRSEQWAPSIIINDFHIFSLNVRMMLFLVPQAFNIRKNFSFVLALDFFFLCCCLFFVIQRVYRIVWECVSVCWIVYFFLSPRFSPLLFSYGFTNFIKTHILQTLSNYIVYMRSLEAKNVEIDSYVHESMAILWPSILFTLLCFRIEGKIRFDIPDKRKRIIKTISDMPRR